MTRLLAVCFVVLVACGDRDREESLAKELIRTRKELAERERELEQVKRDLDERRGQEAERRERAIGRVLQELREELLGTEELVKTFIPNLIERYKQEFGQLPPMNMKELNAIGRWRSLAVLENNTTNECNECLLVALRHRESPLSEDLLPARTSLGNTDEDTWIRLGGDGPAAREILDGLWPSHRVHHEEQLWIACSDPKRERRSGEGASDEEAGRPILQPDELPGHLHRREREAGRRRSRHG